MFRSLKYEMFYYMFRNHLINKSTILLHTIVSIYHSKQLSSPDWYIKGTFLWSYCFNRVSVVCWFVWCESNPMFSLFQYFFFRMLICLLCIYSPMVPLFQYGVCLLLICLLWIYFRGATVSIWCLSSIYIFFFFCGYTVMNLLFQCGICHLLKIFVVHLIQCFCFDMMSVVSWFVFCVIQLAFRFNIVSVVSWFVYCVYNPMCLLFQYSVCRLLICLYRM